MRLYLSYRIRKDQRYQKQLMKHASFKVEIREQFDTLRMGNRLSQETIDQTEKCLKSNIYFDLFNRVIEELFLIEEYRPILKVYVEIYIGFLQRVIKLDKRKGEIEELKLAKLFGYYQMDLPFINQWLLKKLNKNSMYLKLNVLTSLAQIGNSSIFAKALTSSYKDFELYNNKVLIGIMQQFSGDYDELNRFLIRNFKEAEDDFQLLLIQYFTVVPCPMVEKKLCEILSEGRDSHKEICLSIIKYFANHPNLESKSILLDYLKHNEWEYRVLSAKALQYFSEEDVINQLFIATGDFNWHVRFNSAMALCNFNINQRIKEYILQSKDYYSRDILQYALSLKEKSFQLLMCNF